jgi:peptidyl-prolyl cis-trans isomerase B (cyclophilin B)
MKKRMIQILALMLATVLVLPVLSACGKQDYPVATITMENGDTITLYLYPDKAPNTVANFISLANSGFYDGLTFHRCISSFLIQGGDPNGDGTGGPGYYISGEFADNGYTKNDLEMEEGVIAMARFGTSDDSDEEYYDTAGSQFFILTKDKSDLDGKYAVFGKVFYGMNTVNNIAKVTTDSNNKPREDQVIKTIRVETYGVDYGEPTTIPIDED